MLEAVFLGAFAKLQKALIFRYTYLSYLVYRGNHLWCHCSNGDFTVLL